MKCFMHPQVEAVSVCKRCGKAMCADCSSYTAHSGICPACRKEEYEIELSQLITHIKEYKSSIIITSIFAVLIVVIGIIMAVLISPIFAVVLLVDLVLIYRIVKRRKELNAMNDRKTYLVGEIGKINRALTKGNGMI
ncbi:MAG: hypothetical protein K2P12_05075 [Clostridia bacterium]|nr:hypothetical protein [Clostridia bacterium]